MISPENLYKLEEKDINNATQVLFDSFKNDFSNKRLLENEKNYDRSLFALLKLYLGYLNRNGYTYAESKNMNGISIWQKSDKTRRSPYDFIKKGGLKFMFKNNYIIYHTMLYLSKSRK